LEDCISKFEKDPSVTAMVLTGSEKAFAAGADIKEMASKKFADVFKNAWVANWGNIGRARKPIVAVEPDQQPLNEPEAYPSASN